MMSDSQKAFVFLKDNIPSWLNDLEDINSKVVESQSTLAQTPITLAQTPITPGTKSVKKTGSTESIRPNDLLKPVIDTDAEKSNNVSPVELSQHAAPGPEGTYQPPPAPPRRKRKTASLLSNHTTGQGERPKYRTRSMIVIYYDSRIQNAFEQLVRNISSGRNMLRKGKMAAKMEALAAEINDEEDEEDDVTKEVVVVGTKLDMPKKYQPPSFGRSTFRSSRLGPPSVMVGEDDPTSKFDETDKLLEIAQSLCEKAAHQFLRDGDCRDETKDAKEKLQQTYQRSIKEVELQEEKAKKSEGNTATKKDGSPATTKVTFAGLPSDKRADVVISVASKDLFASQAMALEVDDEDDDEDAVPLPPIRAFRTTRALRT